MNTVTIEDRLGILFQDRTLLAQALVHGSHVNESEDDPVASNERMEFLGDAVLGMVITEELYRQVPDAEEGVLTSLRSTLVRRQTLAAVGRKLRLGDYLVLGRGEAASGGRNRERNLADAVEAVVGAVYLDQGYEATRNLVLRHFGTHIKETILRGTASNYKAMLQELLQSQGQPLPQYRIVTATGPDHEKEFTAEVLVANEVLGSGKGQNRKAAETHAARHALSEVQNTEE